MNENEWEGKSRKKKRRRRKKKKTRFEEDVVTFRFKLSHVFAKDVLTLFAPKDEFPLLNKLVTLSFIVALFAIPPGFATRRAKRHLSVQNVLREAVKDE